MATAKAALATLQEAGAAVRARLEADPELYQAHGNFAPGEANNFLVRWGRDVMQAVREAAAGEPLSILQCGDLGRADRCLTGIGPHFDERPGAITRQQPGALGRSVQHVLPRSGDPSEAPGSNAALHGKQPAGVVIIGTGPGG
jgi:hypothetical protein